MQNNSQPVMLNCSTCGKQFNSGISLMPSPFVIALANKCQCTHCGAMNAYDSLCDLPKFNLAALNGISADYRLLEVSKPLEIPVVDFVRNMDRVVSVHFLLAWLTLTAYEHCELAQSIITKGSEGGDVPDPFWVKSELHKHMTQRQRDFHLGSIELILVGGETNVDDLIQWRGTEGVGLAIESALASMLIGAWTAFEVLVGDIWEACLNARPNEAIRVAGEFLPLDATGETEEQRKKRERARHGFLLKKIQDEGFDLTDKMGTVLRDDFPFIRLSGIIETYKRTFNERDPLLQPIVNELRRGSLKSLAALRHVLVHCGGIADKDFIDGVQHDADLRQIKIAQRVTFDGQAVANLVHSAINNGCNLVRYADQWLIDTGK
jgi:hypothetical protein